MSSTSQLVRWGTWGVLAVTIAAVGTVFLLTLLVPKTPPLPEYGEVPNFVLTNQVGRAVTLADLTNQVWVANIVFTRCPGPCLQMTRQMKLIQDAVPPQLPVRFISLTADPDFDSPAVLEQYAQKMLADENRWQFLTGPKQRVYGLAMKGLKLAIEENPDPGPTESQFIHSTRFVVIDQAGRLRGVSFDGTDPNLVSQVVRTVKQLVREGRR